jgi:hypothetical protein
VQLNRQPIRIRVQTHGREIRLVFRLQHHAGNAFHWLRDTHSLQETVIDGDRLIRELCAQPGVVQVEVNAWRIVERVRLILHLVFEIDDDGTGVRA